MNDFIIQCDNFSGIEHDMQLSYYNWSSIVHYQNKQVCDFYDGYNRDVILEIMNNVTIRKHYLIHKESGTVMQMPEYKLDFDYA